ncbi:MAG: hypothetical protein CVU40_18635 [Chloroflexi bacterium HGW-Chloroflexi-2]|nr:MAG: hypothetical protein CVU40_18635 [Chloroflexi bacterium HGW-Chloroflexi-2]
MWLTGFDLGIILDKLEVEGCVDDGEGSWFNSPWIEIHGYTGSNRMNSVGCCFWCIAIIVGMKDRRTKPLVEYCVNSPILHPYLPNICVNQELEI